MAGILDPPALTKALPVVEERTGQYAAGLLRFYAERAGKGEQARTPAVRGRREPHAWYSASKMSNNVI